MIELIQFPWSPFCIVQRRILEYGGIPFKAVNIPNTDRTQVWKLTRERYYGVPVIKDGHISAPKGPGLGTKLLPGVARRKDATVRRTVL